MSLEKQLQENTAALREFTALMARILRDDISITAQAYREAKAITVEPAVTTPSSPSSTPAEAAAQSTPAPAPTLLQGSEAASVVIPVTEVNSAILKLAKTRGREAAVGVLARFGVAKVPELQPEQYAGVLALAEEALA